MNWSLRYTETEMAHHATLVFSGRSTEDKIPEMGSGMTQQALLLFSYISSLSLLPISNCVNLALYTQNACVCVCVRACTYALRIVSVNKILSFTNSFLLLIIISHTVSI